MTDQSPQLGGGRSSPQPANDPRLGGEAVIKHIMEALTEESSAIRKRAVDALAHIGTDQALAVLMDALHDENNSVVRRAVQALGDYGWPVAPSSDLVERLMELWYTTAKRNLIVAFGRIADPRPIALLALPATEYIEERMWALSQIGRSTDDVAVRQQALEAILHHAADPLTMLDRLVWPTRQELITTARHLFHRDDDGRRLPAALTLAHYGDDTGVDVLFGIFNLRTHKNIYCDLLARLGDERPLHMLCEADPADHLGLVAHYVSMYPPPLSEGLKQRLNALLPLLMRTVDDDQQRLSALTILSALGTPEADAVFGAWIEREAHALIDPFLEDGQVDHIDTGRLFALTSFEQARRHPLMQAHAGDVIYGALQTATDARHTNLAMALARLRDARGEGVLLAALTTQTQLKVLKGLSFYPTERTITAVVDRLQAGEYVLPESLYRLAEQASTLMHSILMPRLAQVELSWPVFKVLGIIEATDELNLLTTHADPVYRGRAAHMLGIYGLGDPATLEPLLDDISPMGDLPHIDIPYRVCDAARDALERL